MFFLLIPSFTALQNATIGHGGFIANGPDAFERSRLIHQWTDKLTLFTNGASTLGSTQQKKLSEKGIKVVERDGSKHPLRGLFARGGIRQPSFITRQTGCALQAEGMHTGLIQTDDFGKTTVPGIYAAGDNTTPLRSLSAAIAAGMKAGAIANQELIVEDF